MRVDRARFQEASCSGIWGEVGGLKSSLAVVKRTWRGLGCVGRWAGKGDSMVWGLRNRWVLVE